MEPNQTIEKLIETNNPAITNYTLKEITKTLNSINDLEELKTAFNQTSAFVNKLNSNSLSHVIPSCYDTLESEMPKIERKVKRLLKNKYDIDLGKETSTWSFNENTPNLSETLNQKLKEAYCTSLSETTNKLIEITDALTSERQFHDLQEEANKTFNKYDDLIKFTGENDGNVFIDGCNESIKQKIKQRKKFLKEEKEFYRAYEKKSKIRKWAGRASASAILALSIAGSGYAYTSPEEAKTIANKDPIIQPERISYSTLVLDLGEKIVESDILLRMERRQKLREEARQKELARQQKVIESMKGNYPTADLNISYGKLNFTWLETKIDSPQKPNKVENNGWGPKLKWVEPETTIMDYSIKTSFVDKVEAGVDFDKFNLGEISYESPKSNKFNINYEVKRRKLVENTNYLNNVKTKLYLGKDSSSSSKREENDKNNRGYFTFFEETHLGYKGFTKGTMLNEDKAEISFLNEITGKVKNNKPSEIKIDLCPY